MRALVFLLDKFQYPSIAKAVRSRFSVISTWMEVIKLVINYYPPDERIVTGSVELRNASMSRVFITGPGRMFSLAFPFCITEKEGQFLVRTNSGINVDSLLTSHVMDVMKRLEVGEIDSEWALTSFLQENIGGPKELWGLLVELLNSEDGYLRFDHDTDREDGHLHPLNHADLFYTNGATFKLGFHEKIKLDHAVDILNLDTDCYYLSPVDRK